MSDLAATVQRLAAEAPAPAVAISVFDRDRVRCRVVRGVADLTTGRPVAEDDWWDLASLTKVLVTLPEALDRLPLDVPLGALWARARGHPVAAATVAELLSHRAGLPASVRFFDTRSGAGSIVAAALRTDVATSAGAVYSDIGFLLLGAMIEDLDRTRLETLAIERSGLVLGRPPGPAAATEHCPWRGRLITGEVHDENAWAMGGAAGHAGAFGTLALVTRAAQAWLAGRVLTPALHEAARRCWSTGPGGVRFGLGWWLTPDAGPAGAEIGGAGLGGAGLGGPAAGPDGFGASGFVGNRLWFEPSRGYGVLVLSNRIHPARSDRAPFAAWHDRLTAAVADDHERFRSCRRVSR
jgi:CubicO group peptidase (beta-lactamase class C family)